MKDTKGARQQLLDAGHMLIASKDKEKKPYNRTKQSFF